MLRLLKRIFKLIAYLSIGSLAALIGFVLIALEDRPLSEASPPPSPEDVRTVRGLVRDARAAASQPDLTDRKVTIRMDQIESALRLGQRAFPKIRSEVGVTGERMIGLVSYPLPYLGDRRWINLRVSVTAGAPPIDLADVRVGSFYLPPKTATWLIVQGLDLVLGQAFGSRLRSGTSVEQLAADEMILIAHVEKTEIGDAVSKVYGTIRGRKMPSVEEIDQAYLQIRIALDNGELGPDGSFTPHLLFTLGLAEAMAQTGMAPENAYTAAIFGLARACGALDFYLVLGYSVGSTFRKEAEWQRDCEHVLLNGREDSRRHFITAAAIQAASNRGVSVAIGEFKELFDIVSGAGGFDLTDIAANNSGIRLSNLFMSRPGEEWALLRSQIQEEADFIIDFSGIPGLMPEREFKARFGDIESKTYLSEIDKIEKRISALPLHQTRR
ncbi:MAG: hypothetical protein AAGC79_18125 [Pseudomonadota bacterium]